VHLVDAELAVRDLRERGRLLFGGAHLARFLDLGFFASIRLERATHEIEIA